MNIDPRLERLQSLIEEKRLSNTALSRTTTTKRSFTSYQQVTDGSNEHRLSSLVPMKSSMQTSMVRGSQRAQSVEDANGGLSKSAKLSNLTIGETISRQGPSQSHLGQYIDLYA